ncbi:hypothetical protein [Schaalia sp. lx-100]|nr:hypothetical protein [Schaalia sp. lx-100]MCD4558219.1 hypothetical protein [Schaalia sp. lx-100]
MDLSATDVFAQYDREVARLIRELALTRAQLEATQHQLSQHLNTTEKE